MKFHNTLTQLKQEFTPIIDGKVSMYVCGPTVYDRPHIGNARSVVVYDTLYRLLNHIYGIENITYVRNITDVDDKINARAIELGISIQELTSKTYAEFQEDMSYLNCLSPTYEPKATEHIKDIISINENIQEISFFGSQRALRMIYHLYLRAHGALVGQGGILNVLLCRCISWAQILIYMVEELI